MINFATYPGTIFKGAVKIILYTLIPVGISNYLPLSVILEIDLMNFMLVIGFTFAITVLAFFIFRLSSMTQKVFLFETRLFICKKLKSFTDMHSIGKTNNLLRKPAEYLSR